MHEIGIIIHMRTTLNIDEKLVAKATELTGVTEKTSLVRMGLEALIAQESALRLSELAGSEPEIRLVPRRRSAAAK